jgi:hypothetical protein
MPIHVGRRAFTIVALGAIAASPCAAQLRVDLGGTVGAYSPLGNFQRASVHSSLMPNSPSDLGGVAYGAQFRLWAGPRLGLELSGATSSSTIRSGANPGGGPETFTPARVSMASAQLLFQVTESASRLRGWVGAGGGAIEHSGRVYERFGKPVNAAGVLELGTALRVGGALNVDIGVTTMIYHLDIRGTPATDIGLSERGQQVDMLLHTGLSYSWQ